MLSRRIRLLVSNLTLMYYYLINGSFYDMTDNEDITLVAREFSYIHNIKVKSIKRISRKRYLEVVKNADSFNEYFVALD